MKNILFHITMVINNLMFGGTKKDKFDNDSYNYFYAEYFLVDPRLKGKG